MRFAFPSLLTLALLAPACAGSLELTPVQHSSDKPSNVAVYFRVSDNKGDPVAGLTAEEFNIYEDEKLVSIYESQQTILNPEVAASHHTLLLVDMSGSVSESDGGAIVAAASRVFTERVSDNNKVAVYAFDGSEELYEIVGFSTSGDKVQSRLDGLSSFKAKDPSTNLNGAVLLGLDVLDESLEKAENPLRFGTLVVFTDGTDRAARVSADDVAEKIEETPYEVFAIGLGAELSQEDLDRIGKDGTALANDQNSVGEAFEAVAERVDSITKSYYLLSYCSPARAGEHEVRVEAEVKKEDKKGSAKGDLSTSFDAEGFKPGCDPNQKPKFDVTQGDALQGQQPQEQGKKRRRIFGGEVSSPGGSASASGKASSK